MARSILNGVDTTSLVVKSVEIDPKSPSDGHLLTYSGGKFQSVAPTFSPVGSVIAFAGSSAPTGWLLCAGQAVSRTTYASLFALIGTTYGSGDGSTTFNLPDLRGRVIVALDNMGGSDAGRLDVTNTLGGSGGTQNHTLTEAQLPSHSHTDGTLTAAAGGAHQHTYSGTVSDAGAHNHALLMGKVQASTYLDLANYTAGGSTIQNEGIGTNTYNHNQNTTIGGVGNHNHTFSGSTSSASTHEHDITGSTGSTGSGSAHNNMQPYLLMNHIIKF